MSYPLTSTSLLFILWCLTACQSRSQPERTTFIFADFDQQILSYEPAQRPGVPDEAYRKGQFFLSETRAATRGNPDQLNVGDYWNITMAFLQLQEPADHVAIAFRRAVETDATAVCAYISHLGKGRLEERIPDIFVPFYRNCPTERKVTGSDEMTRGASDPELAALLYRVYQDDRRYRVGKADMDQQRLLDLRNREIIDSLFRQHRTYIGRSRVGPKLASAMWAVIQHSDLNTMERYLPVIRDAVTNRELPDPIPLKMLLDRIYWLKYGYQIFGSQSGVALGSRAEIAAVKKAYDLE